MTYEQVCEKHKDILESMKNDNIFTVKDVFTCIEIEEACDNWHTHALSKDDCRALSELFNDLSEVIDAR